MLPNLKETFVGRFLCLYSRYDKIMLPKLNSPQNNWLETTERIHLCYDASLLHNLTIGTLVLLHADIRRNKILQGSFSLSIILMDSNVLYDSESGT